MSPCRECAADRPGELFQKLGEFPLGGIERGRHDDRVALDAADVARTGIDDEPVLERAAADRLAQGPLGREGLPGGAITHELDTDEKTAATHVPDLLEPFECILQLAAQRLAPGTDPGHE